MCTIIALQGLREDFPVVVAANRDEFYARPATPPRRLLEEPVAAGGRDLSAGGTWMGVTAGGFFVAVTNRRGLAPGMVQAKSRGTLVLEALRLGQTQAVRAMLSEIDARAYNEFNLMFGDANGLWLAYGRQGGDGALHAEPMPDGLHVLPNDRLDSPEFPKCERARSLVEPSAQATWPELRQTLQEALGDDHTVLTEPPPSAPAFFTTELTTKLSALCVRTPLYGTRSSSVVALQHGRCAHYLHAEGPPDETAFEEVTGLLR
jgi:uncharacterized protein with NRDE domain